MPHDWHCLLSIWKLQYYKTYFHSFIKKLSDLFRSYAKVVNGDRPWQGCPTVRAKKSHPSGVFFRPKPCMGGSGPVHGPCLRNGTKSNKTSKKVYWFFCSTQLGIQYVSSNWKSGIYKSPNLKGNDLETSEILYSALFCIIDKERVFYLQR